MFDRQRAARLGARLAWTMAVMLPIATLVLSIGVGTLQQAVTLPDPAVDGIGAASVRVAWWMALIGYGLFPFINLIGAITFALFIACFGLHRADLFAVGVVLVIWLSLVQLVDIGLTVPFWYYGFYDTAPLAERMTDLSLVLDLVRWPVRFFYCIAGLALIAFGLIGRSEPWPRALVWSSLFLGIMFLLEVVTFAITLVFGSSPVHLPFFLVTFFIAAPWFWTRMAQALGVLARPPV